MELPDLQEVNNERVEDNHLAQNFLQPAALAPVAVAGDNEGIRIQNGGRNSRRPPMTERDQLILREYFIQQNAYRWLKNDKKRHIDALMESSGLFMQSDLSKQQIVRRFDMYMLEYTLREKFGTKFYNATVAMKEGQFVTNNFLAILVEWRSFFLMNPYNGFPDELDAFIYRCEVAFVSLQLEKWRVLDCLIRI